MNKAASKFAQVTALNGVRICHRSLGETSKPAGQQKGTKGKGKGGWRTVTLHPHPSAPPRHPSFTRTLTRTLTLAENPRVRQFWALIPLDGGTSVAS